MSCRNTLPSLNSSRLLITAWKESGLSMSTNQNTGITSSQSVAPPSSINHSEALSENNLPSRTQ